MLYYSITCITVLKWEEAFDILTVSLSFWHQLSYNVSIIYRYTLNNKWVKQTKRSQSPTLQLHQLHPITFSPVKVCRTLCRALPPSYWQTLDLSHPSLVGHYLSPQTGGSTIPKQGAAHCCHCPPLHCLHLLKHLRYLSSRATHLLFI